MTTTADIVVPDTDPAPAPARDVARLFDGIRAMLDGCRTTDRNQLALIAIEALIEARIDTRSRIVAAGRALGFNRAHFGAVLGHTEGHRWRRGEGGVYCLLAA